MDNFLSLLYTPENRRLLQVDGIFLPQERQNKTGMDALILAWQRETHLDTGLKVNLELGFTKCSRGGNDTIGARYCQAEAEVFGYARGNH